MRQTHLVFSGHRDEIITAIARHVFSEKAEQNRKLAQVLEGPLNTIRNLVGAAKVNVDGPRNPQAYHRSRYIRSIIEASNN
jgi:hypothetical protein